MEQIIDGKLYSTATADKIASAPVDQPGRIEEPPVTPPASSSASSLPSILRDSVKLFREAQLPEAGDLYRTHRGNYFVHELRSNQLVPVSRDEAIRWCKKFKVFDTVAQHFTGHVEEA
jgi:hypothetical protein